MDSNNAILMTFLFIFLLIGYASPYIHQAFGETSGTVDIDGLEDTVGEGEISYSPVSMFDIFISMFTIFFWQFGVFPVWLNILFFVPRIIFWVIVYDKVRGI